MLQWGDAEQQAFDSLRRVVCKAPVLVVPVPGKPFILRTDASVVQMACQLAQCDAAGNWHWLC